jgi:hypothetical protein
MRIAILGWGSLIAEPRGLPVTGEWQEDGPMLWIEFSRISKRGARAGCLTLVIDERSDEEIRSLYIVSARTDLLQAIADLQARKERCQMTSDSAKWPTDVLHPTPSIAIPNLANAYALGRWKRGSMPLSDSVATSVQGCHWGSI